MHNKKFLLLLCIGFVALSGCSKFFPADRDSISSDARFTNTSFVATLGRTTLIPGNFNFGTTTSLPLTFEVINMKRYNGDPAPELTDSIYKIKVWKSSGSDGYTGLEKSLDEIENKRTIENHKIFEMRKNSGDVVVWGSELMNSAKFITLPEPGYKFDVKISNSGATKYFYNLSFSPRRSIPYEPNNYDEASGIIRGDVLTSAKNGLRLSNVYRADNSAGMTAANVDVIFNRVGDGNSLTINFLDSAYRPINPAVFNRVKWQELIHGFNMQQTSDYVKYDVAYPIPVVSKFPTKYTNSAGTMASLRFEYLRKGSGGEGIIASMLFDFAIYQPGNWQITFLFKDTSPKFGDD